MAQHSLHHEWEDWESGDWPGHWRAGKNIWTGIDWTGKLGLEEAGLTGKLDWGGLVD